MLSSMVKMRQNRVAIKMDRQVAIRNQHPNQRNRRKAKVPMNQNTNSMCNVTRMTRSRYVIFLKDFGKKEIDSKLLRCVQVIYDDIVKDVRNFILCCIVENVRLADGKFREFLQIQTKLHETVCGKREKSTIATHDLAKLSSANGNFISYTAKDANQLRIHPLGKTKVYTGTELYNELKAEADALRKQKQRNTYSGIHKYLKLLENQQQYACVEDGLGNVISLPPLTNGESTKVSGNRFRISIWILLIFSLLFFCETHRFHPKRPKFSLK